MVSLNPGVRTFQTCFDPSDGCVTKWGHGDFKRIGRLCHAHDKLQSKWSQEEIRHRKRYRLKRKKNPKEDSKSRGRSSQEACHIHSKLGGSKVFECPKCHIVLDRDVNGSRNILLKFLTEIRACLF